MGIKSRRFALRSVTRNAHSSLDALIGDFVSSADYLQYAIGLFAFRRPVEDVLQQIDWPASFNGWRPSVITELLAQDLERMGRGRLAFYPSINISTDISALLGTLYVLEGSTLGARVLYRRVQDIGLDYEVVARHLAAQVAAFSNWQFFVELLETVEPFHPELAAVAANAAFQQAEYAMLRSKKDHVQAC